MLAFKKADRFLRYSSLRKLNTLFSPFIEIPSF
jgi:hypothetical protein